MKLLIAIILTILVLLGLIFVSPLIGAEPKAVGGYGYGYETQNEK